MTLGQQLVPIVLSMGIATVFAISYAWKSMVESHLCSECCWQCDECSYCGGTYVAGGLVIGTAVLVYLACYL